MRVILQIETTTFSASGNAGSSLYKEAAHEYI